jgi:hypothetical protein
MMGEECANPGIGVRQRTFWPFSIFQWIGVGALASTPLAAGPRNWGQLAAVAQPAQRRASKSSAVRVLLTAGRKQKTSHAVKRAKAIAATMVHCTFLGGGITVHGQRNLFVHHANCLLAA